uniref:E3 ubiquitin-protein ligase SINAT3-like n=1 Tax=Rhizophora mucronata TaxID=61149 RepID=A0A2P2KBN5_RHIMU
MSSLNAPFVPILCTLLFIRFVRSFVLFLSKIHLL